MTLARTGFFFLILGAAFITSVNGWAGDIQFDQKKADEKALADRQLETTAAGVSSCLDGTTRELLRSGLRDRVTLLAMTCKMCGGPLMALAKKDETSQQIARKALVKAASETLDNVLEEGQ